MNPKISKLLKLYNITSKHSNYQLLSSKLNKLFNKPTKTNILRYEKERFKYICNNVALTNKVILDVGGNTGYFSFEAIEKNAKSITFIEGNPTHCEFVKLASNILNISQSIDVINDYFNFKSKKKVDIVFLLNVIHHLGDDYGDKSIDMINAKKTMIKQVNSLAKTTNTLILQMGFNWQGDRNNSLFKNGTKNEMINFIQSGTSKYWNILNIGIAEKSNNRVKYYNLTKQNVFRDNSLGEFLNRPIFILESKIYNNGTNIQ